MIKTAGMVLEQDTVLGDRTNMAFAGSLVNRGRAQCVVIGTGLATELGAIAESVTGDAITKAPLQVKHHPYLEESKHHHVVND